MPPFAAVSTPVEPPWERTRLHVPRTDRSLFTRPALPEAAAQARENRARLDAARINVQGRPLDRLRQWSRAQALAAACEYTAALLDEPVDLPAADLLFVGGHQPTLFHPGVWVKNFALGELARHARGTALNLVIDNDLSGSGRIRVPAGDAARPTIAALPWDAERPVQPWEEVQVLDRDLFGSFGERAARHMAAWGIEPLAHAMWSDAVRQIDRAPHVRDAFTALRAAQERRWGTANLELPLSRLCELDPFLWFAGHILAHLPRFLDVHNQVLREYRHVNRIRSRTHPVSDLKPVGDWLEAPFWVWRAGDRQRGRLLARQVGREVWLSDGRETIARLKLSPEMDACCAVEGLRELPRQGIRLRTRALTTTLFARLCLADLFVHGIGGAKYDEMTDRITARFFDLPAPDFLTISATVYLPLGEPSSVTRTEELRLRESLRNLRYNSDQYLTTGVDPEIDRLIAEKQSAVAAQQAARATARMLSHRERRQHRRENRARYHHLQDLNHRLAEHTADRRAMLDDQLAAVRRQLDADRILRDREFAFCLYPPEKLQNFLTSLWPHSA